VQGTLSDTQGGSGNGGGSSHGQHSNRASSSHCASSPPTRTAAAGSTASSSIPSRRITARYAANVLAGPVQKRHDQRHTEKLTAVRGSLLYQVNEDWSVLGTVYAQNLELGGYDLYDSPPGPAYMAHYEAFNIP